MNCTRCKRQLKNPRSVENGMGPVCYKKFLGKMAGRNAANTDSYNLPWDPETGDIICRVVGGRREFNFQQVHTYHSPTGMAWGYGGSGPADFSLNVLSLFLPIEAAYRFHQDFKWKFVAILPAQGG